MNKISYKVTFYISFHVFIPTDSTHTYVIHLNDFFLRLQIRSEQDKFNGWNLCFKLMKLLSCVQTEKKQNFILCFLYIFFLSFSPVL